MITAYQIQLVQSSFEQVLPIAEVAGEMLYERIFVLAPDSRALFAADIRPQAKRLMAAVKVAVEGLDRLDEVVPYLVKLGARHFGYGVRAEHFQVGGEALLWTLEQGLGDALTPEVREAWAAAWDAIAGAMLAGMQNAALSAQQKSDEGPVGVDPSPSTLVSAARL
jgi:nitric oxide dioxygenase